MQKYHSKEAARSHVLSILKKEHEGKWVAITSDYKKIVGYSQSLRDLQKSVKDVDVVYLKGFPSDVKFAFES